MLLSRSITSISEVSTYMILLMFIEDTPTFDIYNQLFISMKSYGSKITIFVITFEFIFNIYTIELYDRVCWGFSDVPVWLQPRDILKSDTYGQSYYDD
jgi:hypothetical protein